MTAEGFGYAKVILLGEHAVVHGQPALAAALDVGLRARAVSEAGPRLVVSRWAIDLEPSSRGDDLTRAMDRIFSRAPAAARRARVEVEPQIPSRAGLGSSAALSVAVVRALAAFDGSSLDDQTVEQLAGLAEEVFHGRASGIDAAVATRGGALRFVRGQPATPVASEPLPVVVAQVEPRAPTREMVGLVAAALADDPAAVERRFETIGQLVDSAGVALESGDLPALGRAMNENHRLLAGLGVSTAGLEAAREAARSAGALGAKLTGAGGGGCMIALAPGREEAVADALRPQSQWVTVARLGGG